MEREEVELMERWQNKRRAGQWWKVSCFFDGEVVVMIGWKDGGLGRRAAGRLLRQSGCDGGMKRIGGQLFRKWDGVEEKGKREGSVEMKGCSQAIPETQRTGAGHEVDLKIAQIIGTYRSSKGYNWVCPENRNGIDNVACSGPYQSQCV